MFRFAALLLLALACQPVLAQSYRCSGPGGTYFSDRPCPLNGGTRLGSIGPAPEPAANVYVRPPPLPGRAPEYQRYMSPECASLNDGLRTAHARGISGATQAELRNDFARRCGDNESQARQRWSQEQRQEQRQRHEQREQAHAEASREAAQQQQNVAQCGEMRRIIASKNERLASLTPGEVNDLRRFEGNYAARCARPAP